MVEKINSKRRGRKRQRMRAGEEETRQTEIINKKKKQTWRKADLSIVDLFH